jgi:hypothetical protein
MAELERRIEAATAALVGEGMSTMAARPQATRSFRVAPKKPARNP